MKIYDFAEKIKGSCPPPSPGRVRMVLAEKGLSVPLERIDLPAAENRAPAFKQKNPMGTLPLLELDDGTLIAESMAICWYFEELHPRPSLMGRGPMARALTEMWNRRMEFEILEPIADSFRHQEALFANRFEQVPAYAQARRRLAQRHLQWLDQELAQRGFIAGDQFSVADITAFCGVDFGRMSGITVGPELPHLLRWFEGIAARTSASA